MMTALEETEIRFRSVLGSTRGGGLAHTNSTLPRPGREGVLGALYAQYNRLSRSGE
jgi:hypothetical protein